MIAGGSALVFIGAASYDFMFFTFIGEDIFRLLTISDHLSLALSTFVLFGIAAVVSGAFFIWVFWKLIDSLKKYRQRGDAEFEVINARISAMESITEGEELLEKLRTANARLRWQLRIFNVALFAPPVLLLLFYLLDWAQMLLLYLVALWLWVMFVGQVADRVDGKKSWRLLLGLGLLGWTFVVSGNSGASAALTYLRAEIFPYEVTTSDGELFNARLMGTVNNSTLMRLDNSEILLLPNVRIASIEWTKELPSDRNVYWNLYMEFWPMLEGWTEPE